MSAGPDDGRDGQRAGLRLVESPEARPAPAPDDGLRAALEDMRRRYRVERERVELRDRGPESPEAA